MAEKKIGLELTRYKKGKVELNYNKGYAKGVVLSALGFVSIMLSGCNNIVADSPSDFSSVPMSETSIPSMVDTVISSGCQSILNQAEIEFKDTQMVSTSMFNKIKVHINFALDNIKQYYQENPTADMTERDVYVSVLDATMDLCNKVQKSEVASTDAVENLNALTDLLNNADENKNLTLSAIEDVGLIHLELFNPANTATETATTAVTTPVVTTVTAPIVTTPAPVPVAVTTPVKAVTTAPAPVVTTQALKPVTAVATSVTTPVATQAPVIVTTPAPVVTTPAPVPVSTGLRFGAENQHQMDVINAIVDNLFVPLEEYGGASYWSVVSDQYYGGRSWDSIDINNDSDMTIAIQFAATVAECMQMGGNDGTANAYYSMVILDSSEASNFRVGNCSSRVQVYRAILNKWGFTTRYIGGHGVNNSNARHAMLQVKRPDGHWTTGLMRGDGDASGGCEDPKGYQIGSYIIDRVLSPTE